ncbi:hypothetical protein [Campylobacter cuniculorum]|uniref:hypothetical protein n=1 Tax=Campylobacter cuniculorum TaxID=374106 RepID=UPI0023F3095A|nr:hypothetical protein [Campylobacter cuniculorum]
MLVSSALFGIVGFVVTHYKTLDFVLSLMVWIIVLLLALVTLSIDFNKEFDKKNDRCFFVAMFGIIAFALGVILLAKIVKS